MKYHKPTLWDTNLVFYEKSGFFYYKKLKQHVFIDGQLINKQLSENPPPPPPAFIINKRLTKNQIVHTWTFTILLQMIVDAYLSVKYHDPIFGG